MSRSVPAGDGRREATGGKASTGPGRSGNRATTTSGGPGRARPPRGFGGTGGPRAPGARQKEETKMSEQNGAPVVVTTEHRGVFFGYLHGNRTEPTVELRDAQMCVYWSEAVRGVLGLASRGPDAKCKVTAPVSSVTLHKVTAVMDASDEAVKAWLAQPWSRS